MLVIRQNAKWMTAGLGGWFPFGGLREQGRVGGGDWAGGCEEQ